MTAGPPAALILPGQERIVRSCFRPKTALFRKDKWAAEVAFVSRSHETLPNCRKRSPAKGSRAFPAVMLRSRAADVVGATTAEQLVGNLYRYVVGQGSRVFALVQLPERRASDLSEVQRHLQKSALAVASAGSSKEDRSLPLV